MADEFKQHAFDKGEVGKHWLEQIPRIIKSSEQKWDIKVLPPFKLTWNYVAPVKRKDGSDAVLKIGYPKDQEFRSEIAALELFHGQGIEQLLEEDPENAAILIEQIKPGVPLSELEDDEEATRILIRVMKKLWKPVPPDYSFTFTPVLEWAKDLFQVQEWYKGTTGPLPAHITLKAQEYFKELASTQDTPVLVHGDLHHDNVLSSHRDGWIAIDPKGILAEPCYEVAAMIRNPYEKLKNIPNLEPLLEKRIQILSEELGFDRKRIQKWCIAQSVLSAVWSMEGVKGWEHGIRVAEALDRIKV